MRYSVLFVLALTFLTGSLSSAESPPNVVERSGVKGGLVVCIGDTDGTFLAGLRTSHSFLVQGLLPRSDLGQIQTVDLLKHIRL